jgi:hypothetical protein
MSQLSDLIFTELVHTLQQLPSIHDKKQAHAICLALARAFAPDRPDSIAAGRQIERDRTMALINLRLEQLEGHPRERAELLLIRAAILGGQP